MFSKEVVVRCESGLHNKQATYFVQKANEFESSIWLESGNRKMNAKSLLGIMSLGIISGSTVTATGVMLPFSTFNNSFALSRDTLRLLFSKNKTNPA